MLQDYVLLKEKYYYVKEWIKYLIIILIARVAREFQLKDQSLLKPTHNLW
jgi:hypothetical protein